MNPSQPARIKPRKPAIPNGIVGMTIFIAAETMFFAALISSYLILRAGVPVWPPWGQPRLPVWTTAFNTLVLFSSAVFFFKAKRAYWADNLAEAKKQHLLTMATGGFFLAFQGYEWMQLINFGLTLTSSNYGGIFYLIIGLHALHAIGALFGLLWVYRELEKGDKAAVQVDMTTIQLLWYFVVGMWPMLYVTVYLL